jgi:hypothetical protein
MSVTEALKPMEGSEGWQLMLPTGKSEHKLRQNGLFLSFPYVCPEPVLVKSSFL